MTKTILFLFCLPIVTHAEVSGKTADGCVYRIINGKYLTDCGKKPKRNNQEADEISTNEAAPVTSYDIVPVKENSNAPQSSFGAGNNKQSSLSIPVSAPVQSAIVIDRDEALNKSTIRTPEIEKPHLYREKTYFGLGLGSNTIRQSKAGSSIGFNVALGTNLGETLGIELNYAHTNQGLILGSNTFEPSAIGITENAKLSSNLFSAELQFHLTDTLAKIRPYIGGGFAMKLSSLEEVNNTPSNYGYGYGQYYNTGTNPAASTASLKQQSLGATAVTGLKIQVSRSVDIAGKFSYYAPLLIQGAQFSAANTYPQANPTPPLITQEDSALTGSSQYQIAAELHYIF